MTLIVGTDTYVTLAEADEYFASSLKADDWDALSDATKEILLKSAVRRMEGKPYLGTKQVESQALEFPRYFDNAIFDGTPDDIKSAQCEIALSLYQNQDNKILQAKAMGLTSISLGNQSYSLNTQASGDIIINQDAQYHLNQWTRKGGIIA